MTDYYKDDWPNGDKNKPDPRPVWDFKKVTRDQFEFLQSHITKVETKWRMTSSDESEQWLELTNFDGKKKKFSEYFFHDNPYFKLKAGSGGLVKLTDYHGELMKKRAKEIAVWEHRHNKEIAEYRRLKEKYG